MLGAIVDAWNLSMKKREKDFYLHGVLFKQGEDETKHKRKLVSYLICQKLISTLGAGGENVNQSEMQTAGLMSVKPSYLITQVYVFSHHTNTLMKQFIVQKRSYVMNARFIVLCGPRFITK